MHAHELMMAMRLIFQTFEALLSPLGSLEQARDVPHPADDSLKNRTRILPQKMNFINDEELVWRT